MAPDHQVAQSAIMVRRGLLKLRNQYPSNQTLAAPYSASEKGCRSFRVTPLQGAPPQPLPGVPNPHHAITVRLPQGTMLQPGRSLPTAGVSLRRWGSINHLQKLKHYRLRLLRPPGGRLKSGGFAGAS